MKRYEETIAKPEPAPDPKQFLANGREVGVIVPLLQNLAGGFAADALLSTGATVVYAVSDQQAQALDVIGHWFAWAFIGAGAVLGIVVFCVFTLIRAFRDEVQFIVATWARAWAERRNTDTATALEAERKRTAELERALREVGGKQAADSIEVQSDAFRILVVAFQGGNISRRAVAALGIGPNRWKRARELLAHAAVIAPDDRRQQADYPTAVQTLQEYLVSSRRQARAADGTWYVT